MKSNKEMFMREQLGIITRQDRHCFDVGAVGRLCVDYINADAISIPEVVFTVIDPCGGGASAMAIVTGFMNRDLLVVRPRAHYLPRLGKCAKCHP